MPESSTPRPDRGRRRAAPATTWRHVRDDAAAHLHLLRRATWGPSPEALAELQRLGSAAWLQQQLDPAGVDDAACDALAARFPRYRLSPQRARAAGYGAIGYDLMFDTGRVTLLRRIWSRRQLLEVVVDVWNNLLHVPCPTSEVWDSRADYDRSVVRRHALGSFPDMLVASARHPAMLVHLDGASSSAEHPNENYARELLELHTLGVDAGWTEADVRAAALLLTGLAVAPDGSGAFDPARHHTGALAVLGHEVPEHPAAEGMRWIEGFLRHLALHPATARRVCRRLAVRFVSDSPPEALVERMARAWLRGGGDVVEVLEVLLGSPEFWASAGQKVRTPHEDFTATLRTLGTGPEPSGTGGAERLYWLALDSGHAPMAWPAPDGYPDVAEAWRSASGTLQRWNRHMDFAGGWYPGELEFAPARDLLGALPGTWGGLVDALVVRLVGSPPAPAERAGLLHYCGRDGAAPLDPGDPWLRTQLPYLAALVLDGPSFCVR